MLRSSTIAIGILAIAGCGIGDETYECRPQRELSLVIVVRLDRLSGTAELLGESGRKGTLITTDSHYKMDFPEKQGAFYLARMEINRYRGEATWEVGNGERGSSENLLYILQCQRFDSTKKL